MTFFTWRVSWADCNQWLLITQLLCILVGITAAKQSFYFAGKHLPKKSLRTRSSSHPVQSPILKEKVLPSTSSALWYQP